VFYRLGDRSCSVVSSVRGSHGLIYVNAEQHALSQKTADQDAGEDLDKRTRYSMVSEPK